MNQVDVKTGTELYKQYEELCGDSEIFYRSSQFLNGYEYVSFNYRLASYTDFISNDLALECRGITFCVNNNLNEAYIFSRPFEKFFNYKENPFTEESVIANLNPILFMDKVDGSMITVGITPEGDLLAKSKSSINSEQAVAANRLIKDNYDLGKFCFHWVYNGFTPIFEYISPDNCIVIRYPEEKLVLIGLRNIYTGEYINIHSFPEQTSFFVTPERVKVYNTTLEEVNTFLENDRTREGFVVIFNNGQRVKFKTLDYVRKHRVKDSINNIKHLADLIINDGIDDILPLFSHDQVTWDYIMAQRNYILSKFYCLIAEINDFHAINSSLERKEYAIKAQADLGIKMGLAMSLYLQRDPKFEEYFLRNELYKDKEDETI